MKKIYLNKQCGGTKYKASEMKDKSLNLVKFKMYEEVSFMKVI